MHIYLIIIFDGLLIKINYLFECLKAENIFTVNWILNYSSYIKYSFLWALPGKLYLSYKL